MAVSTSVIRRDQRRDDAHHLPVGAAAEQEQLALEGLVQDALGQVGARRQLRPLRKLDPDHQPSPSHLGDAAVPFGRLRTPASRRSPWRAALARSPSDSITSSVATAAAQATALPPYVPPWEPGGNRSSSSRRAMMPESGMPEAIPLAMTRMSGERVVPFRRPHPAGASHAGLHLVGDQQDAVAVGDLPQCGQERVRRDHVAALAQDRLDQEGGHVIGVDDRREELLDPRQAEGHRGLVVTTGRVAQRVRVRREMDAAEERLEVAAVS